MDIEAGEMERIQLTLRKLYTALYCVLPYSPSRAQHEEIVAEARELIADLEHRAKRMRPTPDIVT